jgi:prepilin-type N-terminal cleavage/methylation domain-containing protein
MIRRQPRRGVTLIEVLTAIFIMGIGMLALLVLYPIGAMKMGQALKDDRCASSCIVADSIALAWNLRKDPIAVGGNLATTFTSPFGPKGPQVNTAALPRGPSFGIYVDPYGYLVDPTKTVGLLAGVTPGLPRATFSVVNANPNLVTRWCTLLDDITFTVDGTPDLSTGFAQRAEAFTWAWLLREPAAGSSDVVDLTIVVYRKRDTTLPPVGSTENTYRVAAGGTPGSNTVSIVGTPSLRPGQWVLDSSVAANGAVPGYFYRVVGYTTIGGVTELEFETNLKQQVTAIAVLDSVAEVFERGAGWKPL